MIDLLVVCAPGGHLTTARKLLYGFAGTYKYAVHSPKSNSLDGVKVIPVTQSDRDMKFFIQLYEAFIIIKKNKPKVILSTGAGVAVSFFIVGKMYGAKLVFVESQSRVHSISLSGKLVSFLTNRFYVRYKDLANKSPRYIYIKE